MRLGSYPCIVSEGTIAHQLYHSGLIHERHRHRYEVNNKFVSLLEKNGIIFSGKSPDGKLMEMIELKNHRYYVGCQFHPELKSRVNMPHPLFVGFVRAAKRFRDDMLGKQNSEEVK